MAGQKPRLGLPGVAAEINRRHATEPDGWRRNRLLAVKLAAQGEHTAAQIAELCGIARGAFVLLDQEGANRGARSVAEAGEARSPGRHPPRTQ